jgi:hypothetical protein
MLQSNDESVTISQTIFWRSSVVLPFRLTADAESLLLHVRAKPAARSLTSLRSDPSEPSRLKVQDDKWVYTGNVTCKGPLSEIGTYRECKYSM